MTGPELTHSQGRVLDEMSEELGWSAARLSDDTGMTIAAVKRCQRELSALGLAVLSQLTNDEGMMAGRGYILTPDGGDIHRARHDARDDFGGGFVRKFRYVRENLAFVVWKETGAMPV